MPNRHVPVQRRICVALRQDLIHVSSITAASHERHDVSNNRDNALCVLRRGQGWGRWIVHLEERQTAWAFHFPKITNRNVTMRLPVRAHYLSLLRSLGGLSLWLKESTHPPLSISIHRIDHTILYLKDWPTTHLSLVRFHIRLVSLTGMARKTSQLREWVCTTVQNGHWVPIN